MLNFPGIIDLISRIAAVEWRSTPLKFVVSRVRHNSHESVSRSARTDSLRRRGETRPHRHRHAVDIRPSDALQSGGRLPDADHQEAAAEIDRARTLMVSRWRHQYQIPQEQWRFDLGRMGRR